MKDFDLYKKIISLPDFLLNNKQFGFHIHKKGSSRNNPKLTNGNMTIVIKKVNDKYSYFEVNNPEIKKSILDFMQEFYAEYNNGIKPPLPIIANILDDYIANGKTVLPEFSHFSMNNPSLSEDDVNRNILRLQKEGNKDFLIKRGFGEKTYNHENFKSILLFRNITDRDESIKTDIAFIMHGINSKCISIRGEKRAGRDESFKGFQGPKSDTIASSHFDPLKPINFIFIGESMIDCMAHFELNFKELKEKNILYLSSEGSITESQIKLIQGIINKHQPQNITTIFDNDLYGTQATNKIFSHLLLTSNILSSYNQNSKALLLNLSFIDSPIVGSKTNSTSIFFNFPNHNLNQYIDLLSSIISKHNSLLDSTKDIFSLKLHSKNEKVSRFELSFRNDIKHWKITNSIVLEFKFGNSQSIKTHYPKSKDFNQDLLNYKGLSSNKKIDLPNDFSI